MFAPPEDPADRCPMGCSVGIVGRGRRSGDAAKLGRILCAGKDYCVKRRTLTVARSHTANSGIEQTGPAMAEPRLGRVGTRRA